MNTQLASCKAIETRYKGYRFRSRLEARWAVFFDAINLEWEYEPEGFELPGGERYLPDFRIGRNGRMIFAEIKPTAGDTDAFRKARLLAHSSSAMEVICLGGLPSTTVYPLLSQPGLIFDGVVLQADPSYYPLVFTIRANQWSNWRRVETVFDPDGLTEIAISKAKSARFEFGESGFA